MTARHYRIFAAVASILIGLHISCCILSPSTPSSLFSFPKRAFTAKAFTGAPVITSNFPDPSLIRVNETWYSFATQTNTPPKHSRDPGRLIHVQIAQSYDFRNWTLVVDGAKEELDALPNLPGWVDQKDPRVWAPDVVMLDDGTFLLYFSAAVAYAPAHHCIGAARSTAITGPYTPLPNPIICPLEQGGAIDASGFVDTSTSTRASNSTLTPSSSSHTTTQNRYILYKLDGNSLPPTSTPFPHPTTLLLLAVAPDGTTPLAAPVPLLDHSGRADEWIVEAPSLFRAATGTYVLFFSCGAFGGGKYRAEYAVGRGFDAGFERRGVLLAEGVDGVRLTSPGGMSVSAGFDDGEEVEARGKVVFHADSDAGGNPDGLGRRQLRQMYVGEVEVLGERVVLRE